MTAGPAVVPASPAGPPPSPPPDLPPDPVVAEVRAAFEAYEAALAVHDVAVLDRFFEPSPQVRRFGVADEQRGAAAVRAWRAATPGVPPDRRLEATEIQLLRPDVAVVTTRFGYGAGPAEGRQTQVWLHGPDGWRIASAHVSLPAGGTVTRC